VLFLGVIPNADGCVFCCSQSCSSTPTPTPAFDAQGRRVFNMRTGQFVIVVEGAAGLSKQPPGKSLQPGDDARADLQIESARNMGNGSLAVCDTGPAAFGGGGVPGINPPDFQYDPMITDALDDFACRFQQFSAQSPCTFTDASGEPRLINLGATVQFCDFVAATALFPSGDSLVTVRLRDVAGNTGPAAQIVVRVATPTPTPKP
jgi:hypothetical protein